MAFVGDIPVMNLSRAQARQFVEHLTEQGLKTTSVRRSLNHIVAILNGTTKEPPAEALKREVEHLQALPAPWRADIAAARPQAAAAPPVAPRPAAVVSRMLQPSPLQHPLRVYDALLERVTEGVAA